MIRRTLAAFLAASCLLMAAACSEAKASPSAEQFEAEISDSVASGEHGSSHDVLAYFREYAKSMCESQRGASSDIGGESEYVLPSDMPEEPYDASGGFDQSWGGDSGPASCMGNPNGLNSFDGVYEYNGKTETFYANHAVYDDQLWVDDEGFWRTDDGHYVVASVDYAEGTEIEISQGKAIVMDGGCEPGVVDVHVSGWN